jgi:hypothetical protein
VPTKHRSFHGVDQVYQVNQGFGPSSRGFDQSYQRFDQFFQGFVFKLCSKSPYGLLCGKADQEHSGRHCSGYRTLGRCHA